MYSDDLLVFCTEDGVPLSAPLTNQMPDFLTKESQETTLVVSLPNQQETVRLPSPSQQETIRTSSSPDTKSATQITNKAPWFLFGGSVLVIIGLVLIIGIFIGIGLLSMTNTNTASTQNRNQQQPSNNKNNNKPDEEDVETNLKRLNDEIAEAYCQSNTSFLDDVLANDYTYKDDRGFYTTKPQIIGWLQAGIASYDYVKSSNVVVNVEANKQRAILAGKGEVKGRLNGQDFVDSVFFRNVYEKRNDRWQLVSVGVVH